MNDLNDIIHRQDTPICVGVDVSKDSLQVHVLTDRGQRDQVFANTNVGICKLKKLLQQFPSVLVCCENTGGYELKMVVALQKEKIDVRAVNPKRILAYRQSIGRACKTDQVDALIIALYAEHICVKEVPPLVLSDLQRELAELFKERDCYMRNRVRFKLKAGIEFSQFALKCQEKTILHFQKVIQELDARIIKLLKSDNVLYGKFLTLKEIPGIGNVTAMALVCMMPELGVWEDKKISSLAGLAPFNNDSGKMKGKRHTRNGRQCIKSALYMAAVVAITRNPEMSVFYKRLRSKGKPSKVALVAVARRLLCYLNRITKKYYQKQKANKTTVQLQETKDAIFSVEKKHVVKKNKGQTTDNTPNTGKGKNLRRFKNIRLVRNLSRCFSTAPQPGGSGVSPEGADEKYLRL